MTDLEVLSLIETVSAKVPDGFMIMPDNLEAKRRLLAAGLIMADHPMNYGTMMLVRPTPQADREHSRV